MVRRNKLSPEEAKEILARPFDIWPEPKEEAKAKGITKRGALPWHQLAFNFLQPWSKRLANNGVNHACSSDRLLAYSGSGSGKTILNTALHLWFMTAYPGVNTFSGAFRYNTIEEIQHPIFKELLSIRSAYDHPYVTHIPNKQDKYLELTIPCPDPNDPSKVIYKVSTCYFSHLSDYEILRGKTLAFASAEEISQCKDPKMVDELDRRLRSPITPYNMLFATTNPPASMSHFVYEKWPSLFKWAPEFDGEAPKPRLCTCQYCPECDADEDNPSQWEWDENNQCSNPNCVWLKKALLFREQNPDIEICRFKRPKSRYRDLDGVERDHLCPGGQDFWRVLHPSPQDNIHNPSTMVQSLKAGHNKADFDLFVKGSVMSLTSNRLYPDYSYAAHVMKQRLDIDPTKDIYWTHDHNNSPRCSAVIQLYPSDDDIPDIRQIGEIVLSRSKVPRYDDDTKERIKGATVEDVCDEFIKQYKEWNEFGVNIGDQKTVYCHGDHTAWNNKGPSSTSKNEFQIMKAKLTKAGFKVKLAVIKKTGVKIQISVADRIALVNYILRMRDKYKINKDCLWTHKSFSDLERKTNDAEATDKSVDELARRSTNYDAVHLVSHITEAIGYLFARKFNLVKQESGELKIIYISDQAILDIAENGTISRRKGSSPVPQKQTSNELLDLIRQSMKDSSNDDFGSLQGYFNF